MSVARKLDLTSIEEYLASDAESAQKCEYVGGVVYSMADGSNRHTQIASNALISIGGRLRGHRCRAFNSDTKILIRMLREFRFYYPDLSELSLSEVYGGIDFESGSEAD